MAVSFLLKSRIARRLLSVFTICTLLPNGAAWGLAQQPLNRIPVPVPRSNAELAQIQYSAPNGLAAFVKDVPAAIALGKALFWDMQVGSDGRQACASCHYGAGADPISTFRVTRTRNQLHPGPDTIFGNSSTVIKTFTTDPLTDVDTPRTLRAEGNPRLNPNYALQAIDFPLFKVIPVESRLSIDPLTGLTDDAVDVAFDTNDVVGSQGIRLADFVAVNSNALDSGTPLADQIFHTGPAPNTDIVNNVRQVTNRNTPSVINAVFNFTNFWDGRANNIFNGETPYGPLDQAAGIWIDDGAALVKQKIAIPHSSLASQAVAPPVSDVMMSFRGRTFPEIGKKLLGLRPLDQQLVHPSDSVLGVLSRATLQPDGTPAGNRGLSSSYQDMIEAAFQDHLWGPLSVNLPTIATPGGEPFSQTEANFSLFWGLAIQLYEATLVSDQTPFDRFQSGNRNALSAAAQRGFTTFDSSCTVCHSGTEFTSASIGSSNATCAVPDCNRTVFTNNTTHTLIRQEANPDTLTLSVTDTGFFNTAIRATSDDSGRGAAALDFLFPLSFTRLARLANLPFSTPLMPPLVTPATPDTVEGSFKTPGLRNVELTPPYFHNGSAMTLEQVMEFYTRGGNFPDNPQRAVAIQPIGKLRSNPASRFDVVEFLKSLTDERVRNEQAPFDHPELLIPNGIDDNGAEILITLPATGGAPAVAAPQVLTLNPVTTPAIVTSQVLSGTVDTTATVAVSVNNGTPFFATIACSVDPLTLECLPNADATSSWSTTVSSLPIGLNSITITATSITGGTRSISTNIQVMPTATISGIPPGGRTNQTGVTLTIGGNSVASYQISVDGGPFSNDTPVATPTILAGLSDATHTVTVLGKDALGNQQPIGFATTRTWTVKANPPVLTLNAVSTPTGNRTQTISGTVELGSIPSVAITGGAVASPVRTVPGTGLSTWSCDISGLAAGTSTITVTARDFVFNTTTAQGVITRVLRDGNFKETGTTDISDALKALRFAVGMVQPTTIDMIHGDLAPLVNGLPTQDERIDIADALLILRKTVGLVTF